MIPEHLRAVTYHKRTGRTENSFSYGVDFLLTEPEGAGATPFLFSRNRPNLVSQHDLDHGGERGKGKGAVWVRDVMRGFGHELPEDWRILLLAQPRMLGSRFSPVSFWLVVDAQGALRLAIAEVNNTFGDRHSYLCASDDLFPIEPHDTITARKVFHVSPFQPVEGEYRFRFAVDAFGIAIRIDYRREGGGLIATLAGRRRPLTNAGILGAILCRPVGAARVLLLIYAQALALWMKGASYRSRPEPPASTVSR